MDNWLKCSDCQVGASNRQARFMAGLATTGAQPHESSVSDAQLLEAAKANLRTCTFIGLMERYEESMTVLR